MRWSSNSSIGHHAGRIALLSVFLATTAFGQTANVATNETRNFTGNWTASGSRQLLDLGPGHQAGIFSLSGTILMSGMQQAKVGFQAEVIGFSDTTTGMQGRSVWTDRRGDKIFSELSGDAIGPGKLTEGKLTGGTGRYAGISGEYSFKWQRIGSIEGDELTGRVVGLSGQARFRSPGSVAPTTSGGPK
jgi:hypothetical protein